MKLTSLSVVALAMAAVGPLSAGQLWLQNASAGEGGSGFTAAGNATSSLGAFNVVIAAGTSLQANAPALAAFERAASTWESYLSDPITVTINADVRDLGLPSVLGQAGAVMLNGGHGEIRDAMIADSAVGTDEGVVALLPTLAQMTFTTAANMTYAGNIALSKANAKALGFSGLDAIFGVSDATIEFNSAFAFDYDRSDGIAPGSFDFESVALHEIGHALGFFSAVDEVDVALAQQASIEVAPTTLDLFRFALGGEGPPTTAAEFTTGTRSIQPGVAAAFVDLSIQAAFSTGVYNGDGRQASHWKDNALTGSLIGALDPTISPQQVFQLSSADLRAFDLIGWDLVSVPEPGLLSLASLTALLFGRRRR
ncbi:MAG: hypothetical protein EAZ65_05280 [Verrucomicrobia bacterium]|nr:MAG: hypothetical protein EAZ82_07645 [Verrucomicrobiota bacterium]TAF25816.1 MAG: hypothetical protein EAZ71_06630 [Verrucomicrobiota bacterium]TAF41604.1 MAG: hypothetical protein EAZ65_05280 [Verrucomicrobiota bacterium]